MTKPVQISTAPLPFNSAQRAALDALMDLLIPASRDGRMPAARTLGLYGAGLYGAGLQGVGLHGGGLNNAAQAGASATLRAADRALFEQGLAALDALAQEAHGAPFAQLGAAPAKALVDALRNQHPAFVQCFVTQTVGRYLAHPVVMPLLGLEPRPPWPQGNVVAEGDWSMLDVVKRREKIYRKV